jgi:hypothetical protein
MMESLPLADYLGQKFDRVELYTSLFNAAALEIMGETPFINSHANGISFRLDQDQKIDAIFLYAQGVEDFAAYDGALPAGRSFSNTREDVRAALGEPSFSGEAGGAGIMAIDYSFDRFENDHHYIRFEYTAEASGIRLVTIGVV